MATAGKILMFPVGNWTSGNNYGFLDIVYYGGSSYIAKTDITNSTTNPVADTANWQILAHGYIADTLSGIDGIDTSGLLGTAGETVSSQTLIDKIADMVADKLVLKTAISNQQINDSAKVTGSALAYSMGQSIDTLNSNLIFNTAGESLKSKYVLWSCNITAGTVYQGSLNFNDIGIDPSKVVDCFIAPHNSLPHRTFLSVLGNQQYAWSETYSGTVYYGLWVLYRQ